MSKDLVGLIVISLQSLEDKLIGNRPQCLDLVKRATHIYETVDLCDWNDLYFAVTGISFLVFQFTDRSYFARHWASHDYYSEFKILHEHLDDIIEKSGCSITLHLRSSFVDVKSYGVDNNISPNCIYMEKASFSLEDAIINRSKSIEEKSLSDKIISLVGCCEAFSCLHSHKIIHRDIKPSNILVFVEGSKWILKICDFGIAKINLADYATKGDVVKGSYMYWSHELLKTTDSACVPYSEYSDVYAFGIAINEYLSNTKLKIINQISVLNFAHKDTTKLKSLYQLFHHDTAIAKIIADCWCDDPQSRGTFEELAAKLKSLVKYDSLEITKLPINGSDYLITNEYLNYLPASETNLEFNRLPPLRQINSALLSKEKVLIGGGSFGTVHKQILNGVTVAVKIFSSLEFEEQLLRIAIKREAHVLQMYDVPGVVRLIGVDDSNNPSMIYMEYGIGTLKDILTGRILQGITLKQKVSILADCCRIFSALCSYHIIHRNIKPSNILMMPDYKTLKVTGFHKLRSGLFGHSAGVTPTGTHAYMAPELLMHSGKYEYSEQTDMYAFAIMMNEVLTGVKPFDFHLQTLIGTMYETNGTARPALYEGPLSEMLCNEILKRWNTNTNERGTFNQLYQVLQDIAELA